jgi:hypothetical protein
MLKIVFGRALSYKRQMLKRFTSIQHVKLFLQSGRVNISSMVTNTQRCFVNGKQLYGGMCVHLIANIGKRTDLTKQFFFHIQLQNIDGKSISVFTLSNFPVLK